LIALVGKKPWFYIADPALVYSFRKKYPVLRCGLIYDVSLPCARGLRIISLGRDRGWMDGVPVCDGKGMEKIEPCNTF
jgi:hypothetical protein